MANPRIRRTEMVYQALSPQPDFLLRERLTGLSQEKVA
jgi:hypothetical protein